MSAPAGTFLRGVEMPLPPGERVLWEGAPDRGALARHAFHVPKLAGYFVALVLLSVAFATRNGTPWAGTLAGATTLLVSGAAACGFGLLLATLTARTTVYAVTERRVVLRIGIALPVVLNVPLRLVESVDVRRRADGRGDLALRLAGGARVAYLVLWPHARAWRLRHPEPLLRDVADVDAVGATLRTALLAQMAADAPAMPAVPRAEARAEALEEAAA